MDLTLIAELVAFAIAWAAVGGVIVALFGAPKRDARGRFTK